MAMKVILVVFATLGLPSFVYAVHGEFSAANQMFLILAFCCCMGSLFHFFSQSHFNLVSFMYNISDFVEDTPVVADTAPRAPQQTTEPSEALPKDSQANETPVQLPVQEKKPSQPKVFRTTLRNAEDMVARLHVLMKNEKLFLDAELRLQKLANVLSVNVYQLSEALNQIDGRSFYDYVNSYRVEYVKEWIIRDVHNLVKLETICYGSGFNNRTSFNKAFKKNVGVTPTEFRTKLSRERV